MSCRYAQFFRFRISSEGQSSSAAIFAAYSATLSEWPRLYSSLDSIVADRACIIRSVIASFCSCSFSSSFCCLSASICWIRRIVRMVFTSSRRIIPAPTKSPETMLERYTVAASMPTQNITSSSPRKIRISERYLLVRTYRKR